MSERDERIGTAIGLHLRFIIMLVAGAVVATQIGWPWWAGAIAAWGLLILVTTPPLVEQRSRGCPTLAMLAVTPCPPSTWRWSGDLVHP